MSDINPDLLNTVPDALPAILSNARYTVHNAAEALEPLPPVNYIVDKLIIPSSVNLFVGDGGIGKTYALIHQLVCACAGTQWVGLTTRPVRCLIIDEESGETRMKRRLSAIMRGEAVPDDIPLQYVCIAGFKLDDKKDPVILEALINETGAEMVLFDALQDIMDGDENSKQETMPVFTSLRRIADRTNAALNVIHHTNRQGNYRGSTAIKGSVDLMMLINKDQTSGIMDFKTEKIRDGEPFSFSAKPVWTDDQFYMNAVDRDPSIITRESDRYVLNYLQVHGPSTIDDIQNAADVCSPRAAKDAVYRLAKYGAVKRTNPHCKIGERAIFAIP